MIAFALSLAGASAAPAYAQPSITQETALRLAFPEPLRIDRRTAYLDDAQLERARTLAGGPGIRQSVVTYYIAFTPAGAAAGVAYFDSHRVRTLGEVIMVVVEPNSAVRRIELLRFAEPPEYRAPERWLELFDGRVLAPELSLKRAIPNLSGATLTANAITQAVRRVLALHTVIAPFEVRP